MCVYVYQLKATRYPKLVDTFSLGLHFLWLQGKYMAEM